MVSFERECLFGRSCLSHGAGSWCRKSKRSAGLIKRFAVPHQLPAPWLRQLRPNWHSLSNDTIRQDPEYSARRGALNFGSAEARCLRATSRSVTMTFGAVLFEENGASSNGVWIVLQRICAVPCLFGCLLQFRVDGRFVCGRCADGRFVGILALRKNNGHHKKRSANGKCRGN